MMANSAYKSLITIPVYCLLFLLDSSCGTDTKRPFDYCQGQPPAASCYAQRRNAESGNIELAWRIAQKQIALHDPTQLPWDWGESVLMLGFHELYRVTGYLELRDYYQAWIDHHLQTGYEIGSSDTVAPAQIALALYLENGQAKYKVVVEHALHFLYEEALRTEQGGINHLGKSDILGVSLWIDSLFMFGNLLTRWGENQQDTQALGEFSKQHAIFSDLLQKPSGFYKHAYGWAGTQDDDVFWGRGNGWVAAATVDYLRVKTIRSEKDLPVSKALDKLFQAIIDAQDANTGLWWTVLNRPGETYLETSASALFAYALARAYRYSLAPETVLDSVAQAMRGLQNQIQIQNDGPVISGISGPTSVGTYKYYAEIPVKDDISYGVGATILALVETSGLLE